MEPPLGCPLRFRLPIRFLVDWLFIVYPSERLPEGLVRLLALSGESVKILQAEGNIVSVNGMQMFYEEYGEGEPLVLLHGFTQSS